MDRYTTLRSFVLVADCGSFAAAAHKENVTPVVMGRRLDALERHLGVKLMHRSTRGLSLTDLGEQYLERARGLLKDLGFAQPGPTPIYVDNEAVHYTAHAEFIAPKNRHIKTKYFLIHDHVDKELSVPWVRGTHNPADLLTKALPTADHAKHRDLLLSGVEQAAPPKPSGRGGVNGSTGAARIYSRPTPAGPDVAIVEPDLEHKI